ncbi:nitrogenase iron-molybdenum cofactor biosynthesis protein NifN [Brenneria izbisi]|uniref:Nitrogenase iron-molybdenum cofactor biosynthesis protein NifN n=2 Tax=Enterobacterales TaxID=91347 RepID=A0AA42C0X0_9GAMM|nr:nitrogenase iron-molybdenum cofactor biosynthesis protein NifN [Brenneria izbisi]MCV9877477.1 nitrogenase iron-molybdenum cofactor biosynthesis protein NifN [Brenneria izbisi]MCV9880957.1 nitrogenase iron-molybdenum cofactor biosynthesis protein NifN [Brenneria izbisi]
MAQILKSVKPLATSPIKSGQPLGAILASMGLEGCIPLVHGAQGCSAFAKVFFIQHFHEPIPLQTTAMDPITTIMGSNNNVLTALSVLCERHNPRIIVILSTGLSEAQGTDLALALRQFREEHPKYQSVMIITANSPDFYGSMENGYAAVLEGVIEQCVPATMPKGIRKKRVNLLLGHMLTPGDHEQIRRYVEAFGLQPVMLPDLAGSLDGHLTDGDFSALTQGGTSVRELEQMGQSVSTIAIGVSLQRAARLLENRCQTPSFWIPHLMTMEQCDNVIQHLQMIAGREVPAWIERQRGQLQDAMIDTHVWLQDKRLIIAAEGDLLAAWLDFAISQGIRPQYVVAPTNQPGLSSLPVAEVQIGDLEDVEDKLRIQPADMLCANSHGALLAEKYHLPLIRIGFPLFDRIGEFRRLRQGYSGMRDTLFELANAMRQTHHEMPVYHSPLKQDFSLAPGQEPFMEARP